MTNYVIPSSVVQARRANTDTLIGHIGTDIVLHNVDTIVEDKLRTDPTITYKDPVATKARILWTPEARLLRELGLYHEGELPILAYFKYADDVQTLSWIEVAYEYEDGSVKTNRFTVVDHKIYGYGIETVDVWVLAPRRRGTT